MIARWVQELIYETIDPWIVQEPTLSKDDLLAAIMFENQEGDNMFMGTKQYNTAIMIRRVTPWVADIHIFSKQKDPWKIVKASRAAQQWIFDNTDFHRLEMRTHLKGVCKLAQRCGWTKEGEHSEAVCLKDGTFVTEYTYGIVKDE